MNDRERRIIAGAGVHERTFSVLVSVLSKSPVISDWIHDKDSIPPHMLRGHDFLFAGVEPDIVQATINYLSHSPQTFGPPIERLPFVTTMQKTDVLFRVKLYKFALCLGLTELCEDSLIHIEILTCSTPVFLNVLATSMEERMSLVDETEFRKWLVKYITHNRVNLTNSPLVKEAVSANSELAWKMCCLLMSALGDAASGNEHRKPLTSTSSSTNAAPNVPSLTHDPSRFEQRTSSPHSHLPLRKSPGSSPSSNSQHNLPSSQILPEFQRRRSNPYSYAPRQKSNAAKAEKQDNKRRVPPEFEQRPSSPYAYRPQPRTTMGKQDGGGARNPRKRFDKRFRATVEDTIDLGDELL